MNVLNSTYLIFLLQKPMHRIHSIAAILIFGLATPVLTQAMNPMVAVASDNHPNGSFTDGKWDIEVYYQNGTHQYRSRLRGKDKSIQLSGADVSRDGQRKVYTWNNNGTRYQVVWKSQDPNFIRVRVTNPSGKEVLNRLMSRSTEEGGC